MANSSRLSKFCFTAILAAGLAGCLVECTPHSSSNTAAPTASPENPNNKGLAESAILKIYPLGDSITRGLDDSGYRTALYKQLEAQGVAFHFVGSLSNGPAWLPEKSHEGHNGWKIDDLIQNTDAWLALYKPDIILLMIGANDIEADDDLATIETRYRKLLSQIIAKSPTAQIYVSEVSLIRAPDWDLQAQRLNTDLPAIVSEFANKGGDVKLVPMHDILSLDQIDVLDHPTPVGNEKMATRWMSFLNAYSFTK